LLSHRSHRARHDRHRRAVACDRPPAAGAARARDDGALGHGASGMNASASWWARQVRAPWTRWTKRWPALQSLLPFVPLIALWWALAAAEFFPRAFFPGPP